MPQLRELEHGVPIPRGIRHADPLVELRGHFAGAETVGCVQVSDGSFHLNFLALYGTGTDAFQVFWLRENYIKEKKDLEFRSNVVFKETVRKLQGKKWLWR